MSAGFKKLVFVLLTTSFVAGCSTQNREISFTPDPAEVMALFNDVETAGVGNSQRLIDLKNDPYSTIFYASAPGLLGPVISVLSVIDFGFLGESGLYHDEIETADIAFIDLPTDQGHQSALLVRIRKLGSADYITQTFESEGFGQVIDGEFVVVVSGATGQLVLRSYDVDKSGNLKAVIQLRVNQIDSSGNEVSNGKFSTLVGFGG